MDVSLPIELPVSSDAYVSHRFPPSVALFGIDDHLFLPMAVDG